MWFTKLLSKVLPLKKGELAGDRIAKFCYSFVNSLIHDASEEQQQEEDNKVKKEEREDDEDEEDTEQHQEEEDTPRSIFVSYLIKYLLRGIEAKDKSVRYRVVQLLAYLVEFFTEIHDNDTFEALYKLLDNRLEDKESVIRIHALVAMSHFQQFEFKVESEDGETEETISTAQILEKIINCLQHDESPEVRRAALMNLLKTRDTIPTLLERARDPNFINRRLVYSKISRELGDLDAIDFENREYLLKWGLNDRDPSVQMAAAKMLSTYWYDSVNQDILELIDRLNVTESSIAEQALSVFFKTKPELLKNITIDESFWKNLTTEKAFLMRSFYQYCNQAGMNTLINSNFPELLDLAETLQKYLEVRLKAINDNEDIVKLWESHDESINKLDDQIFSLENQVSRIENDVELNQRNLANADNDIEEFKEAIKLINGRIEQLENDEGDIDDLKTEENAGMIDQIRDFSEDDLKEQLDVFSQELENSVQSKLGFLGKLKELEKKFETNRETLIKAKDTKSQTIELFETEHADDCIPFSKKLKELEFVINQLLQIAKDFDLSDEIGRRKLSQIIRTTLTEDKLPENLISVALKVLNAISINEKDFVSMAVEIITDIRDSRDEEFHSAAATFDNDFYEEDDAISSKKRKVEADMPPDDIVLRCLIITGHVLEVLNQNLDHHLSLSSIYSGIVNYALQSDTKKNLHLAGLRCLGLFALIDHQIAEIACKTIFQAAKSNGEEVKTIGLKAIMDILATYGMNILDSNFKYRYSRFFYKTLLAFETPKLQCIVAEGLCKLFLSDVLNKSMQKKPDRENTSTTSEQQQEEDDLFEHEKHLFEALILIYFNPHTKINQELQQILSFCIPVYAFSKQDHQTNLTAITGDVLYRLFSDYEQDISPTSTIQQLISWCDPRNLVKLTDEEINKSTSHVYQCVYVLQVLEQTDSKNIKKVIINNLNKFFISDAVDSITLQALVTAVEETKRLLEDTDNDFVMDRPTKKNFDSFVQVVQNTYETAKKREDEEEEEARSSRSNSVSILQELEDEAANISIKKEVDSADVSQTSKPETSEDEDEDDDEEMKVEEVKQEVNDEKQEVEPIGTEDTKAKELENSLNEIDKFLDEEDDVDYGDISMGE
ncbi:YCG1 Condensin complex subunit 3 [Candida maltosa Xu316]